MVDEGEAEILKKKETTKLQQQMDLTAAEAKPVIDSIMDARFVHWLHGTELLLLDGASLSTHAGVPHILESILEYGHKYINVNI